MPVDYKEFARTVKAKYPQYKDVDDLELTTKMIEKYPEYKDKVDLSSLKKKKVRHYHQRKSLHPFLRVLPTRRRNSHRVSQDTEKVRMLTDNL